jgi:hypothetical protein
MPTDLLSESRAQSKEGFFCPKPMISSEHDPSREPALTRSTIVGGRTSISRKRERRSPLEWHFKIPRLRRGGGFAPTNTFCS